MLFNSAIFLLLFLPACLLINYCLKGIPARNTFLLIASALFYWFGEPALILLLLFAASVNYFAAILIEASDKQKATTILFLISCFNLGLLGWYKYSCFFLDMINSNFHTAFNSHLAGEFIPLGISFYTFHLISYTVDVYRKVVPAQRNLINIGLYVLFFPQLVAGPLVRYHYIAPQFAARKVNFEMFSAGLNRFVIGLSKKCLIADPLGLYLYPLFKIPGSEITFTLAWVGMIGFLFQLYFDFSGYADIAIGLGKMFGFKLPENFNNPLSSKCGSEFWNRWHIQLGLWMQQYLYQPMARVLAKKRPTKDLNKWMSPAHASELRTCLNTLIFFVMIGFWHGASWNFVMFGLINGLIVVAERVLLLKWLVRLPQLLQRAYFFMILLFVLTLFRTDTFDKAVHFWMAMFGFQKGNASVYPTSMFADSYFLTLVVACALLSIEWTKVFASIKVLRPLRVRLYTVRHGLRLCSNLPLYSLCICEIAASTQNPFLYFKF